MGPLFKRILYKPVRMATPRTPDQVACRSPCNARYRPLTLTAK